MKTSRRKFIRKGALFLPAFYIFVPNLISRQPTPTAPNSPYRSRIFPPAAGGGGGCTTVKETYTGTEETNPHNQFGAIYAGNQFTAASSYTLCAVELTLAKVGSPTFNDKIEIWSDDGGTPGKPLAKIGTESAAKAASSYGTTPSIQKFTGMSVSIVNGTKYHRVLHSDGAGGGGNYVTIQTDDQFHGDAYQNSGDGSTWNPVFNRNFIAKNYSD